MHTRAKGALGESIACDFLVSNGYTIVDRNYYRKWGELDIVAVRDGILHFIEVKSDFRARQDDGYRAEELVHNLKQRKLRRIISTYLVERGWGLERAFIFDLIVIRQAKGTYSAAYSVSFHENLVI